MAVRLSGLASGMDTDSIVEALMSAQKYKKTKIENKKQKLEWKQTIWKELNTKIYDFYKNQASKLRFTSAYSTKSASSSNSNKITATASNSAVPGTYKVKVNSTASAQFVTSAKVSKADSSDKSAISTSTKLSELGMKADGSNTIKITSGSKEVELNVNESTTVGDFVNSLKSAGLNASYDSTQGRFFISSKTSGTDQAFSIQMNGLGSEQSTALSDLKTAVGYSDMSTANQKSFYSAVNGLSSIDSSTDSSTVSEKQATATDAIIAIKDKEAKTAITNKYKEDFQASEYEKYLTADTETDEETGEETTTYTLSDENKAALEADGKWNSAWDDLSEEKQVEKVKSLISTDVANEVKSDEFTAKVESAVNYTGDSSSYTAEEIEEFDALYSDLGIANKTDRDAAVTEGVANYISSLTSSSSSMSTSDADTQLGKLGLATYVAPTGSASIADVSESTGIGMAVIAAKDSEVVINGATLKSSNTSMEVNGLTLNLIGTTDDEVTLTVQNDTTAVYDNIKEFISEYNDILDSLNTYYNAASARSYNILTDEEKEAMSEDEIEKWNTKIKSSLLRKDSTLGGIIDTMRNSITGKSIKTSSGKSFSLANLGICLGTDYKEYGKLHIKGDEDDKDYADSTNTLKSLLNSDPDSVTEALSGLVGNLYSQLTSKMKSSSLSSALTFYNDKQITKQMKEYETSIDDWEDKLATLEERYYSQFSAMETAMSTLNSQQNLFTMY